MAEYKKTDLKSKLETDLADNSKGNITAKTIRNSMLHIVDSITPIVGSGTQNFFKFDLSIRDSGIATANTTLNRISAKWGTNSVSSIDFQTGSDTLNKGDGGIDIWCYLGWLRKNEENINRA